MKSLFSLLILLPVFAAPLKAQFAFEIADGGIGKNYAKEIIKTSDGGFAVAGVWFTDINVNTDPFLRKTDADGNTIWQKTYGGPIKEDVYGLVQTADGGYTVLYSIESGINGGAHLLKTNSAGDTLWRKRISKHRADAFIQTNDGGYAVVGKDPFTSQIMLFRTNQVGDTLWTRQYFMQGTIHSGYDLIQTIDGGFAITGKASNPLNNELPDIFLLKTNINGVLQWDKRFGTPELEEEAYALQQTPDDGYLIGGTVKDFLNDHSDALLIKTNNVGDVIWTKKYNYVPVSNGYQIEDLALTDDGNYILCGYGWNYGFSQELFGFLLKVNPQGEALWNHFFEGQGFTRLFSVLEDVDGTFVCAGETVDIYYNPDHIYFFKTGFANGTKEVLEAGLHIEPNPVPAGQFMRISLAEDISAYHLILFDALGRLVWQKTGESTMMDVPAPAQRGVYVLVVKTADGRIVGRYLVEVH